MADFKGTQPLTIKGWPFLVMEYGVRQKNKDATGIIIRVTQDRCPYLQQCSEDCTCPTWLLVKYFKDVTGSILKPIINKLLNTACSKYVFQKLEPIFWPSVAKVSPAHWKLLFKGEGSYSRSHARLEWRAMQYYF